MGKTIEELFRSKQLQSSGKTAEKTYDIRNSKDISISSNSPLMGLPFKAMNGIRKTIGFRTKETLLEQEFGGIRPLRLISSPILYGTDIIRLTTRKTNDVQAMKDSINNNGAQGGNNGLIGKVLKKVEGFVTKKLGLPQDTYPTYVINTGKLQKGKEPDTMITIGEIKKDAAGTSFGRFLKQTGGGTPSQLAKQIIGGGLKVTQGAIRTALFGSQTVASLSKGNHNGFVGKYASTANYESSMSTYTQTLALNYLDISAVSPIKGFTRKGEVYGRDLGTKSYGMRLNGRMGEPTSAFLQDNRYWIGDKYTSTNPNDRSKGLPNREAADIKVSSKFLNPKFLGNTYTLNSPAGAIDPNVEKTGRFGKSEYAFELSDGSRNQRFGELSLKNIPKIYTSLNPYSPYGGKSGISTVFDPRVESARIGSNILRTQAWILNSPAGGIDTRVLQNGIFGESQFAFSLSDNTNHKKFGEPTINGLAKIYTSANPYSPYGGVRGISTALNPRTSGDPILGGKMLLEQVWELNSPTTGLKRKFGVFGSNEEYAFRLSDGDFNKKKGEPTADELEKRNTIKSPYFKDATPLVPSKILNNPILRFIQPKRRGANFRYSNRIAGSKIIPNTSNITNSLSTKRGLKSLSDVINQTGVFTASELASIKYNGDTIDNVDLIPLRFTSMASGESIYMRTIVSGFNETFSPSWESSKMIGSPFNFYNYTGVERKVTFNLKAYAMSQIELMMMWRKIEFLAQFNYPGGYTDGGIVLTNLMKFTFGDLYHNRVCFLDSLTYSIEDSENLWDLGEGTARIVDDDIYGNKFQFGGKFTPYEGGSTIGTTLKSEVGTGADGKETIIPPDLNSDLGEVETFSQTRTESINQSLGGNKSYNPTSKKGFIEEMDLNGGRGKSRVSTGVSMSNFRLPKFLNISVGVTFIESRNTTTRLYDFGTALSNDVRPAVARPATADGNKGNNAAAGGGTGGTAAGGTKGPVPVKNVEKKIKGTNVPNAAAGTTSGLPTTTSGVAVNPRLLGLNIGQ